MDKLITIITILSLVFTKGDINMADYNIQMGQRNSENIEWDNFYPITKASNVILQDGRTVDLQLAEKADQSFVDSQFASIVSGAPKGTFTDLTALQTAYPNGAEGVFLVLANGHWYYWNNTTLAWSDGGVYQATEIADKSITVNKLDRIYLDGVIGKNKFDKNNVTYGKYINAETGAFIANPDYFVSDYIPATVGKQYFGSVINFMAIFDENKNWVRGSNLGSTFEPTIQQGEKYIVISTGIVNIDKAMLEEEKRTNLYEEYKHKLKSNPNYVVVSKDGNGDFTTIKDAVAFVNDGGVVRVRPGVYIEDVDLRTKTISLIGENPQTCIIKTTTSDYYTPPIEIASGYVSNLTFYAEYAGVEGSLTAYGAHIDFDESEDKELKFFNCVFKSDKNSALGIGTRKGFKLSFKNCDIITTLQNAGLGGLFFHEQAAGRTLGDSYLSFENCNISSENGTIGMSPKSLGDPANKLYLTFKNNCLYSKLSGITPNIIFMQIATSGSAWENTNNFYLTGDSFGNNVSDLNAQ